MDHAVNSPYTTGDWTTEHDSAAAFDAAIGTDLWKIHREVSGVLTQPRPHQVIQGVRIDRLLIPTDKLLGAGWNQGIIGCEIKRSNVKIGPPIAQAMDYSRAIWTLRPSGIRVWLDWVFIWPMGKQMGTTASVLAQNRIGSASADSWTRIHFKCGENNIIRVGRDGDIAIGACTNGAKVGSR